MTLNEFKDSLFARAQQEGFSEYEIYYVNGDSFKVTVYEKEIDQYSVNTTIGLSFRGLYNGKMGYAYTEVLDGDAIELLVENAKSNAIAIENDDIEIIYGEKGSYAEVKGFHEELANIGADSKIKLALELEARTYAQDERVQTVEYCVVQSGQGETRIINSKGLDLSYRSNEIFSYVVPVVEADGKKNTAAAYKGTYNFQDIDPEELAKEAVDNALAYLGAEPADSGKYRVALRNDIAADFLDTFAGVFSADNAQKGLSLLKGKVGTKIASDKVTLIDDPLLEDGLTSAPFDSEGVPTYTKEVIREGRLETLLHNLKTALKDGVKTTGNASKASYASPVGVSPANFYIKPGEKDRDTLLAEMGDGLLITELQGMHSGANGVSGDFSLAAKGFLIEGGKVVRPVEQITVAGNFFKVLEDIVEVGSDLRFGLPSGGGCFGSPTLLIRELSVAGK